VRRCVALLIVAFGVATAGAETLRGTMARYPITRATGNALAQTIGRSLPVTSASPGVTFTFDPANGAFVRDTEILGQLLLERARPIGRGRFNIDVSYQRVALDTFDGKDLDDLSDPIPFREPGTGGRARFTAPRFRLNLDTNQITTNFTYGITDDLEVNLAIPLIESDLSTGFTLRQVAGSGDLRDQRKKLEGSHFGVGDIFLRAKYRFLSGSWGDLAGGLVLRAPAGSKDDFQGTGDWEITPALYASTRQVPIGLNLRLQGYVNAGIDLDASSVDDSEARYGAGLDLLIGERATLGIAFLGRNPFARYSDPGTFDLVRGGPGRAYLAPIFGVDAGRPNYYDFAVGGRVSLWRDSVFAYGNVIVPLNRDGFRSDVIPMVGLEYAF
jgi:hypothetical protein